MVNFQARPAGTSVYRQDARELNAMLKELGWSGAKLAQRTYHSQKAVSNWRTGKRRMPGGVRAYLELLVRLRRIGQEMREACL